MFLLTKSLENVNLGPLCTFLQLTLNIKKWRQAKDKLWKTINYNNIRLRYTSKLAHYRLKIMA